MKFRSTHKPDEKVELQMTAMIDIVFLLLIFFILSFEVSVQEGDFNVKMPLSNKNQGPPPDDSQLPLKLRLIADSNGSLSNIMLNENLSFGKDWQKLRSYVVQLVGNDAGPSDSSGPEVEIDLDYGLHYIHVIEAITAVTGYRSGNDVVKLIDRIKFAPQRKL
jgi:biopolymer transport protein ExbD